MKKNLKRIYVEITNVCNLSCSFCPKTSRKAEFMDEELFIKILTEVKPYTNYLYFHVIGEPLLHPRLENFLDLCAGGGFYANLTTNGTMINEAGEKIVRKKALRLINFSLHSYHENTNADSDYIKNIFEFISKAEEANPELIICLRLWNYSQSPSAHSNKSIIADIQKFFNYSGEIREIPQRGNGIKLRKNLYLSQDERFFWPDLKADEVSLRGSCLGLRTQIAILADGMVVPCCLDSDGVINLGNIKESGLDEILNSKRSKDIVKGFSEKRIIEELCRKCHYRKRFDILKS